MTHWNNLQHYCSQSFHPGDTTCECNENMIWWSERVKAKKKKKTYKNPHMNRGQNVTRWIWKFMNSWKCCISCFAYGLVLNHFSVTSAGYTEMCVSFCKQSGLDSQNNDIFSRSVQLPKQILPSYPKRPGVRPLSQRGWTTLNYMKGGFLIFGPWHVTVICKKHPGCGKHLEPQWYT